MLTPLIARPVNYLYALGNTPAVNVARAVPPGVDADILLLGCGDVRNLLYTAYAEQGKPPRKLDVTCCDADDFIIARNAVFLSFLVDGVRCGLYPQLRGLYYDIFVDESALEFWRPQLHKLAEAAGSWESWQGSSYGPVIKFADRITFDTFRRTLSNLSFASSMDGVDAILANYKSSLQASRAEMRSRLGPQGVVTTSLRSVAPLSLRLDDNLITNALEESHNDYWNRINSEHLTDRANPLFALPLARGESALHYGTDPTLGFHLAAAFAPLMPGSPLRTNPVARHGASKLTWATQELFREWTGALQETISQGRLVVRFVSADALSLCHTLGACAAKHPGQASASLYRRQLSAQPLELDADQYGGTGDGPAAPVLFDAIDSSNLADSLGVANILFSAGPLLKPTPWAALSTEALVSPGADEREAFAGLLPGGTLALAHMLGFTVAEYWTNATVTGGGLEAVGAMLQGAGDRRPRMFPGRMTWVPGTQLSGLKDITLQRLDMDVDTATGIVWRVYVDMFESENAHALLRSDPSTMKRTLLKAGGLPQSHRGTFVALLKALISRVNTDWARVTRALLDKIYSDTSIIMGNNYVQELATLMHLHGIYTERWLQSEIKTDPMHSPASFQGWKQIPEAMAVTLVVPLERVKAVFPANSTDRPALSFQVTLKSALGAWANYFGALQMAFGTVETQGSPQHDDFSVGVKEDRDGWRGKSPVIVSFYCPTSALQVEPSSALISFDVQPGLQAIRMFDGVPGDPRMVFQTKLTDASAVLFSKYLPGQSAYPLVSTYQEPISSPSMKCDDSPKTSFGLAVDSATGMIETLTGRVDIVDEQGKRALADRLPIKLRQASPFIIEVVFGDDDLAYPLHFSLPIEKEGSRTRIARRSCYIEVIAPLANPTESVPLQDFMHPMTLAAWTKHGDDPITTPSILSSTLPYINLDMLPSLDMATSPKGSIKWLTTFTSHMFSNRERRIREQLTSSDSSKASAPMHIGTARVNFKDSLFTMFMVASGLQGGQTGLFALAKAGGGAGNANVQMLIVISAMRLDCASGTVVADAAVLPLTRSLLTSDADLRAFLALSQSFEICYIKVDDAELALWRRELPSMAERCRTWQHDADKCEYGVEGASLPLPEEGGIGVPGGSPVFCSCSRGRLPKDFAPMPQWEEAAQPHATRVALSLVFAAPIVEEVVDQVALARLSAVRDGASLAPPHLAVGAASGGSGRQKVDAAEVDWAARQALISSDKCLTCGALSGSPIVASPSPATDAAGVVELSRCNGCKLAKYCSRECQRRDWKYHKRECHSGSVETTL